MSISISNIAWSTPDDEAIAQILKANHISTIDIAHSKYFPDINTTPSQAILSIREQWNRRGFSIEGMQSLLFGTTGLNIFSTEDVQQTMLSHLEKVCHIAELLGAKKLVFGSPKNRNCTGLAPQEIAKIATSFFRQLGDIAKKYHVTICLEPNPKIYGANFMTTSMETLAMVKRIDHAAIKMQFDTGAIFVNQEDPFVVLEAAQSHIGHIHISEPHLKVIGDIPSSDHRTMAKALKEFLPTMTKTIEMVESNNESHLSAIERAVQFVNRYYRGE